MKKFILAAALSMFTLTSNATSATTTIADNLFYNNIDIKYPLLAKSKGGTQCKDLPRTCGQMVSCEQAKQALKCGNKKLDRDKDGVPCESICPGG